ncbi:hypothetical protein [Nitrosopumilus sp.]|uniref:hypothetical protein n=1 Tax=Nitrosopumilus sp. TaxID=2024843 RepID=UPI003D0EDEF5
MRPKSRLSEPIKKLRKAISPDRFSNMIILGLNITVDSIQSKKDLIRVIVFLNKSLINRQKDFDNLIKDTLEYKQKQDKIKAHIMANRDKFNDTELFKLLDESDA